MKIRPKTYREFKIHPGIYTGTKKVFQGRSEMGGFPGTTSRESTIKNSNFLERIFYFIEKYLVSNF